MKKTVFLTTLFGIIFCLSSTGLTQANTTPRLVDLGNGIYQDSKTELMWQYAKSKKSFKNEEEAKEYATNIKLGNFTDWRLPTLQERWDLLQVFTYKNNNNLTFPKFSSRYWTTETDKGTTPIKLDLTCVCRGDKEVEYKSKGYVRVVRGTKK